MFTSTVSAPAGTVTDAGICATTVLEDVSDTTTPPVAAFPLSLMVSLLVAPPVKLDGASVNVLTVGAATVKTADLVVPRYLAAIDAVVFALTTAVVTGNVTVLVPARTVTETGTVAFALVE